MTRSTLENKLELSPYFTKQQKSQQNLPLKITKMGGIFRDESGQGYALLKLETKSLLRVFFFRKVSLFISWSDRSLVHGTNTINIEGVKKKVF